MPKSAEYLENAFLTTRGYTGTLSDKREQYYADLSYGNGTRPHITDRFGWCPEFGARVGINCQTASGLTYDQTIDRHATRLGVEPHFIHNYHWLTTSFPNAQETAVMNRGWTVMTSVQPINGSGPLSWAAIAAGTHDSSIIAYANGVKSCAPKVVLVNFDNEPDLKIGTFGVTNGDGKTAHGSEAEFKAAYQRFVDIFRAQGVNNALYVNVYAGIATTNKQNIVLACWPGKSYVDMVAWDPYNRVSDGFKTFHNTINPWYSWAMANLSGANKLPFMLAEYGTEEHATDPLGKFNWFVDAITSIKSGLYPNLKALAYFDHYSDGSGVWDLFSTCQAFTGYRMLVSYLMNPLQMPRRKTEVFRTGDYHWLTVGAATSTSNTLGNGTLRVMPVDILNPVGIAEIGAAITAAGNAGALFRPAIYRDDNTGTYPGARFLDPGTVAADAIAAPSITGLTSYLLPDRYHVGGAVQSAATTQPTLRNLAANVNGSTMSRLGSTAPTTSTNIPVVGWAANSVSGALPDPFPAGASQTGLIPIIHVKVA